MAGNRPLVCAGFVQTEVYEQSRALLDHISDRQLDERLEALLWALRRDPELVAAQVPGRNLWTAVTDKPRLRIYLRPREDVPSECELLWIEES